MKFGLHLLLILLVCSSYIVAQQSDYQLEVLDLNTTQTSQGEILGTYPTPNGVYYHLETRNHYDELYLFKGDSAQLVFRERSVDIHFVEDFNEGVLFSIDRSEPDRYALFINDADGSSINLPIAGSIIRADFMEETQRLTFLTNRRLLGSISGEDNLIDTITTDLVSPSASFLRYGATSEHIIYQKELTVFSSDGTSTGTTSILEFDSTQGSISEPVSSGEKIYFVSNKDLYVTDGTTEGTVQLSSDSEINGLLTISTIGKIYPFKGGVAFTATSLDEGTELFSSDGTPEGTRIVFDAAPGESSSIPFSNIVSITEDYILFKVWNTPVSNTSILAVSDGTEAGTRLIPEIASFDTDQNNLTLNLSIPETGDGDIYFVIETGGIETLYGMNEDIDNGAIHLVEQTPNSPLRFGDFTLLNDNLTYTLGFNSKILESIESPISSPVEISSFDLFFGIKAIKDSIGYFSARTELNGGTSIEIHRTDGTSEGTTLIKEIAINQQFRESFINLVNDEVYFTVDDQTSFEAIFTTDGTEEGTSEVIDFYPNTFTSNVGNFYSRNNVLFIKNFTGSGSETATYSSLGDIESTAIYPFDDNLGILGEQNQYTLFYKSDEEFILKSGLQDPGISITMPPFTSFGGRSSYSREAAFFNGSFFIIRSDYIDDERYNLNLFKIDVSTQTVESVLSSENILLRGQPKFNVYNFQGKIAFLWYEADSEESIWLSDGTPQGTEQLVDLAGLVNSSAGLDTEFVVDKNKLIISCTTASSNSIDLHVFNGTSGIRIASTTIPGRDYAITKVSAIDRKLIVLINEQVISLDMIDGTGEVLSTAHRTNSTLLPDHRMVYLRPAGTEAYETWVTDGTAEGTILLTNESPAPAFEDVYFVFDQNLVFNFLDTFYIYDLQEDHLDKVTFDVLNIDVFRFLQPYKGRLYFYAPNLIYGREIHYLDFTQGPSNVNLSGKIFSDANNNNQVDSEEQGIPNTAILVEGTSNTLIYTDASGNYDYPLTEGINYRVSASPQPCWELSSTPNSYAINAERDTTYTANFGFTPISNAASIRPLLTMARPRCGFTIPAWVTLYNDGCEALSYTSASITLPEGITLVSADADPTISGSTLSWEPGPLPTGESHVIHLELQMPGEEANGEEIAINLQGSAIYDLDLSVEDDFLFSQSLSCAIDPNDKQVTPSRIEPSNSNYTQNDETLTYTIRFQNTGTDTAFNVRLEDQLSDQLDHLTFKPIAASHDYRANMDENGLVTVFFDNILLPDSTINQTQSHGFFTFDVNARLGLEDFTSINNTAGIFFDFNQPIITNTVTSSIVEFIDEDDDGFPFYEECDDENPDIRPDAEEIFGNGIDEDCDGSDFPVSTTSPLSGQLAVFPNPAHQQVNFTFSDHRELVVQLYDLFGREHAQLVFRRTGSLSMDKLPAGTYLLKVTDVLKGETNIQRVIRR